MYRCAKVKLSSALIRNIASKDVPMSLHHLCNQSMKNGEKHEFDLIKPSKTNLKPLARCLLCENTFDSEETLASHTDEHHAMQITWFIL